VTAESAKESAKKSAKVLSTTGAQIGAKALHLVVNIVSTLAIVHYLDPGQFGSYTLAVTTTMLFGLIADGGLIRLAIREVMQQRVTTDIAAGSLAVVRVGLALIAGLFAQAVLLVLGAATAVHVGAAVLSVGYLVEGCLVVMVLPFHLQQRQDLDVGVRLLGECIETAVLLVMIYVGVGLVPLFAAPIIGGVAAVALGAYIAHGRFRLRPQVQMTLVRTFCSEAVPLIPAVVIGVAAIRLDGFVIAWLRSDAELGLYGAAHQPVEYAFLATAVIMSVSFPPLAAAWRHDRLRFAAIHRNTLTLLMAVTLLPPVVLPFIGKAAIEFAYGSAYIEAHSVMLLLSWAIPLMTMSGWNALMLLAGGRQRTTLAYDCGALALAGVMLPFLVTARGIQGGAIGTLIVLLCVCVASTVLIAKHLVVSVHPSVGLPFASAALAMVVGWALQVFGIPWAATGVVVTIVHLGVAATLGGMPVRAWSTSVIAKVLDQTEPQHGPDPSDSQVRHSIEPHLTVAGVQR
jgi:O-antigen/teichoic acid export membrane protein